jgi:microsomal dipeptidase-like Zn-dependent dipeptidase
VVLGIETANVTVGQSAAEWLWSHDVRHVFLIHVADNAFGGASYFQPKMQHQANVIGDDIQGFHGVSQKYNLTTTNCPGYQATGGRCNANGLTDQGKTAVRDLMQAGIIVDVDHMSDRSFSDALDLAEGLKQQLQVPVPVVASHAGFNEINRNNQSHEGQLTAAEYARILGVGGMVGVISGQGDLGDVVDYVRPATAGAVQIPHSCGRSSLTFAQAYLYAFDHSAGTGGIAIGTDFGGPLVQPGARFGSDACIGGKDGRWPWPPMLQYPFEARGAGVTLNQMPLGDRQVDFNQEGLLTVGQLPDLIADLEAAGVTAAELEPLLNSAEAYVEMWERVQTVAHKMPRLLSTHLHLPGGTYQRANQPLSFSVSASDFYEQTAVMNGKVLINNVVVGSLGAPITYTFSSSGQKLTPNCKPHGVAGSEAASEGCTPPSGQPQAFFNVTVGVQAEGYLDGGAAIALAVY